MTETITEPIDRYIIHSTVYNLRQTDSGWWVLISGSWEYLYLGQEQPCFAVGDRIKITLEKFYGKPS